MIDFCHVDYATGNVIHVKDCPDYVKAEEPMRKLECPKCGFVMPLRSDGNYMLDYEAIANHSNGHWPPVVGAWPEAPPPVPERYLSKQRLPGYRCFHPTCENTFKELSDIPCGWTVTTKMVENWVTHNYCLSYVCRCPVHPAPRVDNIFSGESIAWDEGKQAFVGYTAPKPTVRCMHVHDNCLNPDAVAVKWFECALCGRTRSVTVSTDVW